MFMNQENRNQGLLMRRNPQLKDSAACIPKKKRYTKVIKVRVTCKVLVSFFLIFLPNNPDWLMKTRVTKRTVKKLHFSD